MTITPEELAALRRALARVGPETTEEEFSDILDQEGYPYDDVPLALIDNG